MVVFDTSVLLLALDPSTKPPLDPETDGPLHRAGERIEHLIDTLSTDKQTIIIPTPVLSEVLVYAGAAGPKWLRYFNTTSVFRVVPFDQKAALEAALSIRSSLERGGLRVDASDPTVTRGKVKFDRQIVAIAKAEGADMIYSDDADIIKYAKDTNIRTSQTASLDLPPEDPQHKLNFEEEK